MNIVDFEQETMVENKTIPSVTEPIVNNGTDQEDDTKESETSTEEEPSTEEKTVEEPDAADDESKDSNSSTQVSTAVVVNTESKPLELKYLDLDFIRNVLSVPTSSHAEYRMVTFIMMWARNNNIKYEFDTYGNIYLTKGEVKKNEYYPCVTSHLDTVQRQQETYAQCGIPLELLGRVNAEGKHELYVEDMGIGADDKAGVLISLSLFKYFDKLKACFFLEEEVGCCGSKNLKKEWFDNVGYVIGWDSPDRNRGAFACSGELLMSKKLFQEIEETCKEHGLTDFRAEPFTDVKEIRKQTKVQCMNFGNGGYDAHSSTEYVVVEDMDDACGMGVALIKKLGNRAFRMESKTHSYSTTYTLDEDVAFFAEKSVARYTTYSKTHPQQTSPSSTTYHQTPTTSPQQKESNKANEQMLEYVVERYEKYISEIQDSVEKREEKILAAIKELCQKNNVEYKDYLDIFIDNPSTDPFSTAVEF